MQMQPHGKFDVGIHHRQSALQNPDKSQDAEPNLDTARRVSNQLVDGSLI